MITTRPRSWVPGQRAVYLKGTLRYLPAWASSSQRRLAEKKGACTVAEYLQGSAPKYTVQPEDLNVATATMFEGHIGVEFTETTAERVRAKVEISPVLRQAIGLVHGGAYCSIVETVASWGGLLSLDGTGHVVGVNNNTDFLRGVRDDTLLAEASPVFRGRSQQLWRVVITDAGGRECAVGQVRLHNVFNEAA
jgi:1,4-dihydroxy-2-naphthoyl-CoA hydrolase